VLEKKTVLKNKFKDCLTKNQKVIEFKLKKLICNPGKLKGTVSIISSDPSCKGGIILDL